ncbi:MAG: SigB/SigF/SigG family RNA polymerase sigma factor [Acidimicrobiia bacterium]|nr:SigB/SigF/SigG family RNA polymerase sigma factor [Acidimicrobiia bacterium]
MADRSFARPTSPPRERDREGEMERFRAFAATRAVAQRNALAEEFAWVARHCARRFADRGEPFDDLLQVALLGVVKAVDRFDPEHGTSFVSFALPTVLGELRRHFRDATWAVRVPRRLKDLHVEVGATIEFLGTENGRPPTPDQVAAHLGIPVEHVLEALDAGAAYRSSPLNMTGERGDDDEPSGVLMGAEDADLANADDRMLLRQAMSELPLRERRILELRFTGGLSQSEIAEQVGVSQVHVSRLLRKSIRMLQAKLGHGGDDDALDMDDEPVE